MANPDLAVIGGGPAGYAATLRARELGRSVVLIEPGQIGGHCMRYACLPSTIMLDNARRAMEQRELALAGVFRDAGAPSLRRAVARKNALVQAMVDRLHTALQSRQVALLDGHATFRSATTLRVELRAGGTETVEAGAVVLATGSRYDPPNIPGLPANDQLTPDEALALQTTPATVLVIGGGAAGLGFAVEYAHLFAVFGARVLLLEPGPRLLPDEDETVVALLHESLRSLGVEPLTGVRIAGAARADDGYTVRIATATGERTETVGAVLYPDARIPVSDVPGLADLSVVRESGWVAVDARCATSVAGLFAAGDVTGPPLLSNVAARQGQVASENALGGDARVDLSLVPRVLHTEPELAAVGMTEVQARNEGYAVRVGLAGLAGNGRAAALGLREGVIKMVADANTHELLGVHMAVPFASEVIAQAVLALQLDATLEDLAKTVHWHPSIAESIAEAARAALA